MNTNDGIDFLGDLQRNIITNIDEMQGCDKVIKLLQRGEKYEAMWGEFKKKYNGCYLMVLQSARGLNHLMENFEQEHLPKPIKKTITMVLTSESIDLIDRSIKPLKSVIEGWYSGAVKINIKEVD